MPQRIDITTASHRPFIWLPAYMLTQVLVNLCSSNGNEECGEDAPNETTVQTAINLIAEVPFSVLGTPDVSPFFGEIHVLWNRGPKQIVLMCFPDRTPLLHHYLRIKDAPSVHDIENASPDRIAHWLR